MTSNSPLARVTGFYNHVFLLKRELQDYNWEYRRKICVKCTAAEKIKFDCFKVNNFVGGIQETHCSKLENARRKKFQKKMGGLPYS